MRELTIRRDDAGQRLDRFLRKLLPGSPLGNLFRLLRKGLVRVNGRKAAGDLRLAEGDVVELRFDAGAAGGAGRPAGGRGRPREGPELREDVASARTPERRGVPGRRPDRGVQSAPLRLLYRDEHVLAVDKPPFLLVQPGEGGDEPTLDRLVLDLVGPGDSLTFRPGLAHRLDRGTSGIVLFGLSAEGLRGLTDAFRRRDVEKRYLALVLGDPPEDRFTVDLPLARDPSDDTRGAKVKVSRGEGAQEAVTEFEVLGRDPSRRFALVEARPRTGRTHQIRAHLRAVRLPIAGDPTYGDPKRNPEWARRAGLRRQFLHAWRVRLAHPVPGRPAIDVESPLPEDLRRALAWAGVPATAATAADAAVAADAAAAAAPPAAGPRGDAPAHSLGTRAAPSEADRRGTPSKG